MNVNTLIYVAALLVMSISNIVSAKETEIVLKTYNNLSSSVNVDSPSMGLSNASLLSCKTDAAYFEQIMANLNDHINIKESSPDPLKFLNDKVKESYDTMRNSVIRHVTVQVAVSLLNLNLDGFAPENIASYVTEGTQPFLPFEFANGVKISKVTPKGGIIIYRAEMPITKNHRLAKSLALAGKISATTTVCSDIEMVDDLLGRDILIQFDYYDSNGILFSSFTING